MTKHPAGATSTTLTSVEVAMLASSLSRRLKSLRKLTATSVAIIEEAEKFQKQKGAAK